MNKPLKGQYPTDLRLFQCRSVHIDFKVSHQPGEIRVCRQLTQKGIIHQPAFQLYGGLLSFLFLGLSWARLWAVAVLACFLAQYLYARRHGRSHE